MTRIPARLALGIVVGALFCVLPARAGERPDLVTTRDVAQTVSVTNVGSKSTGEVSGTLLNKSSHVVRDTRLLIRYTWLWKNEFRPGDDNPGHADYYTVADEIPPGGKVSFTYRPSAPLPQRSDGHFETSAQVVGFAEVGD